MELLLEKKQNMEQIHEKVVALLKKMTVPTLMRNEYVQKIEQYENMFSSIEEMKTEFASEDTQDALTNQQIEILDRRMAYEVDFAKRVSQEQ